MCRRLKPYKSDVVRVEHMNDWMRTGNGICEVCNLDYYSHPPVIGYEWLHRLCNGDLVKL